MIRSAKKPLTFAGQIVLATVLLVGTGIAVDWYLSGARASSARTQPPTPSVWVSPLESHSGSSTRAASYQKPVRPNILAEERLRAGSV